MPTMVKNGSSAHGKLCNSEMQTIMRYLSDQGMVTCSEVNPARCCVCVQKMTWTQQQLKGCFSSCQNGGIQTNITAKKRALVGVPLPYFSA